MKGTRRNHGATFKAQVLLAAIKGDKGWPSWPSSRGLSHPDHGLEATAVGSEGGRAWQFTIGIGDARSQNSARQDRAIDPRA